jgi:hypothetical protein
MSVHVVFWPAAAVCIWSLAHFAAWLREQKTLRAALDEAITGGRISHRKDLVALKRYLSDRIHFDNSKKNERRPLLRHTAHEILRSGEGFCGENGRVAILLLAKGGVRANRLYLEGKRWGHVAVEHDWAGGYKLFDAHPDPETVLGDEQVGEIPSDAIDRFPNGYDSNPWVGSYRIKVFHELGPLRRWERARPPAWLVRLAESPNLVKALAAIPAGVLAVLAAVL